MADAAHADDSSKRNLSANDDDYGGASSSPAPEDDEMQVDGDESGSDSGSDSDLQFLSTSKKRKKATEATRRSGREGVRKDYTMTLEADEPSSSVIGSDASDSNSDSEDDSDAHIVGTSGRALRRVSPGDDSDDGPIVTSTRVVKRKTKNIGSDVDELADSDGDGHPALEQMHADVGATGCHQRIMLIRL